VRVREREGLSDWLGRIVAASCRRAAAREPAEDVAAAVERRCLARARRA
jgi:hypothetical protein